MARKRWLPFTYTTTKFGDAVEFREEGAVRLGSSIFADGRRIDNYRFDNNVANRSNEFGAVLTITRPTGETYYFRFDGDSWGQLVEEYDSTRPLLYGLRQEMAQSGAIIGLLYWLTMNIASMFFYVLIPLIVVFLWVLALCMGPVFWIGAIAGTIKYIAFVRDSAKNRRAKRFEKDG